MYQDFILLSEHSNTIRCLTRITTSRHAINATTIQTLYNTCPLYFLSAVVCMFKIFSYINTSYVEGIQDTFYDEAHRRNRNLRVKFNHDM